MRSIKRREFLGLGAGATAAILLSQCSKTLQGSTASPALLQGRVVNSQGGLLSLDLEAGVQPVLVGDLRANLLTFNGQLPGPRLEAKPGDTVQIRFANRLNQPTNLHYHGLHVTPQGNADNVFLSVPPGERLTYEFTLPADHPAGTFWYHPHHHGHVAEQLFGGLAGLFIIRGELDEIPEIKAAQEAFMVFQDFDVTNTGAIAAPDMMARMMGREGPLITINGQLNPELSLAQGGLLRLRLLNASPSRFYRLQLEGHSLQLIATDGGAIAAPVELSELLLAPGERAEVLVQGNREPGQYRLLNLPYDRGGIMMMGDGGMGDMNHSMEGGGMGGMMHQGSSASPQTLATVTYRGSVAALPLPQRLGTVELLPNPTLSRRIELDMAMGSGMSMAFLFNGKTFDAQRIDINPKLNTVEEWELVNIDSDRMDHPFHLHVNPFQVISRNGQPEPYQAWKDTVLVKGNETVRIRIPFRTFTGKTVYHCHILDHEDLGMMGTVNIQPA
ncbi:multicopper oxidase family protein [Nodosilinea sp. PGN35]|uniref:multicopper oxidase family protein n=1 Tax=unclassified Nodosilinea TaxID=2628167 RepID=UPI000D12D9FA|nr:multicopper oxidase family protein [Nodosilinea sp. TSF1-S3]MDF0368395.1 multicopper oxidase family protein [Nodosilinea sp. TSF1-S3]PSN11626.1 copper oxidase [filamentous cyanobacterium CCT1]PSN77922.1 copper oxidase [filamentous cyanobacterium CCP4]